MDIPKTLYAVCALSPIIFMISASLLTRVNSFPTARLWLLFQALSTSSLALTSIFILTKSNFSLWPGVLTVTSFSLIISLLVQVLGLVIGSFSSRYLQGELGQRQYIRALATVLGSVQLLLIADHWLILIAAWASIGAALQHLLCFYPDRPFAMLAAHKKRIADRVADALLLGATALAWLEVGSGSLSALWMHIAQDGMSLPLQLSTILLILAVVLRTALLPVHGWLIQVMEAPTPVSALLHAGVINLGGFVLIRFSPMLEQAVYARTLLLVLSLLTAILAGMVMLTRVSIKVRLAWSTVAQMGFMLLECALGLYTLAAIHLIGHSLYKAHAFLSASGVVRQTRQLALHSPSTASILSITLSPVLTISAVFSMVTLAGHAPWPWWWSVVLGLAWAPLLWIPSTPNDLRTRGKQVLFSLSIVVGLTVAAMVAHTLPLGIQDTPAHQGLGLIAMIGMATLYCFQAQLQRRPQQLPRWRRWSYAGFYLDEAYTLLALHIWPTQWAPKASIRIAPKVASVLLPDSPH